MSSLKNITTRHASGARQPAKDGAGSPITPRFILYVFTRWWLVATPVGLALAAAGAGFVIAMFEPEYESKVLLKIAPPDPIVFGGSDKRGMYVTNQRQLLQTPLVLGVVAADAEVANELRRGPGDVPVEHDGQQRKAQEVPDYHATVAGHVGPQAGQATLRCVSCRRRPGALALRLRHREHRRAHRRQRPRVDDPVQHGGGRAQDSPARRV